MNDWIKELPQADHKWYSGDCAKMVNGIMQPCGCSDPAGTHVHTGHKNRFFALADNNKIVWAIEE